MTRKEVEQKLDKKYLGKHVSFENISGETIAGKIHRISAEPYKDSPAELEVIFVLGHTRCSCDLTYFLENTIILDGNTQ